MVPINKRQVDSPVAVPSKLKVLLIITDLGIGGTPLQLYRLALGLKRLGCDVRVACLAARGPIADRLAQVDIPVFPLGARSVRDGYIFWKLSRVAAALRPDVFHSFLVHANVVSRISANLVGVPAVVSTICTAEREHRWHLVLENATCRLADAIVCISRGVRSHMRRRAYLPNRLMRVICPGIDVDWIRSADPVPKERLTSRVDCPVICCIGRLDPVKRVDLVIEALAMIRDRVSAGLVIVGDGPERARLEDLVGGHGVRDRVRFLGFRADVAGIVKSCDLFVLASQQEGWSIATTEALAAGVPAVVTAVEGPCEQVDPGRTGIIVRPGDVGELAKGIVAGLKLPKRPGQVGMQTQRLNYMREAREYYQLYRNILASKTRS